MKRPSTELDHWGWWIWIHIVQEADNRHLNPKTCLSRSQIHWHTSRELTGEVQGRNIDKASNSHLGRLKPLLPGKTFTESPVQYEYRPSAEHVWFRRFSSKVCRFLDLHSAGQVILEAKERSSGSGCISLGCLAALAQSRSPHRDAPLVSARAKKCGNYLNSCKLQWGFQSGRKDTQWWCPQQRGLWQGCSCRLEHPRRQGSAAAACTPALRDGNPHAAPTAKAC